VRPMINLQHMLPRWLLLPLIVIGWFALWATTSVLG
jgi:hypothetical protein